MTSERDGQTHRLGSFLAWLLARRSMRAGSCVFSIRYAKTRLSGWEAGQVGECDFEKQRVTVLGSLTPAMQARTLVHELEHAAGGNEDEADHAERVVALLLDSD